MPQGEGEPYAALSLHIRRNLAGFVLYSAHADGTDLDPDERELLASLVTSASRGYDALHLAEQVEAAYRARADAQAEALNTLRHSNATLERFNEAYARFVPTEFLKFLDKSTIVDVALGDHVEREMTVLFSDIRSFTTISEQTSPGQIFTFLNEYVQHVGPLVREHGGFIDKYI